MQDNSRPGRHKESRRPQFWRVAQRCCQIAATVDVAFFFLFHLLGSPILAWINIISVTMYVVAYFALSTRRNRIAIALIWCEVITHAAVGTVMIGWDSGFHYYLLMFIPALFVSMSSRPAWISVACLWGFYVLLDVTMRFVAPLQPISPNALLGVHLFNLTVVFAMFSYLAFYYMSLVTAAHRKLGRMATTDSLTRLYNRRHTVHLAEKEIARWHRNPSPLAFLLLDVDHFKPLNDRYGHELGDRILSDISTVITGALREQDFIGRWGGEEFLAVLPDTDRDQALITAERIRLAVAGTFWEFEAENLSVTISIGVSEYGANEDLNTAIARADKALYLGKDRGRNRVELATA
ncbi:MAG: diguanylate cyclase [Marinobacter sp.]|uniref:GGDEF domain-containing protein n=1 Tax=Marinobacter sp. TaxID=50741 RepID=UPI0034A06D7A